MESTYQMEEATISTTTREATTITSESPTDVLQTILDLDPIEEKSLVEQPIDKINISAFVSDFNSDSPDSSSEVKTTFSSF